MFYEDRGAGGYDYSRGKSNRAVAAERDMKYPASTLAKKLGVTTSAVRAYGDCSEWHHTSKFYNKTHYYDGSMLIPISRGASAEALGLTPQEYVYECDRLEAMRNTAREERQNSRKAQATKLTDQYVEWLEWSGPRSRRRHTKMSLHHVSITLKGETATIHAPTGSFKKRVTTNGFCFMPMTEHAAKEKGPAGPL